MTMSGSTMGTKPSSWHIKASENISSIWWKSVKVETYKTNQLGDICIYIYIHISTYVHNNVDQCTNYMNVYLNMIIFLQIF